MQAEGARLIAKILLPEVFSYTYTIIWPSIMLKCSLKRIRQLHLLFLYMLYSQAVLEMIQMELRYQHSPRISRTNLRLLFENSPSRSSVHVKFNCCQKLKWNMCKVSKIRLSRAIFLSVSVNLKLVLVINSNVLTAILLCYWKFVENICFQLELFTL